MERFLISEVELNKLAILRGKPIHINEWLTLNQPTIDEIEQFGEDEFYSTVWNLCCSPWDMPSMLDDLGIDFMKISEWDFFRIILSSIDSEKLKLIIDDFDFKDFQPMEEHLQDGSTRIVLYRSSDQAIFDEELYQIFITNLREIIGFQHKGKKAANKATAKILIMDDRKSRKRAATETKTEDSMIFDIIISLVNTEEFSYTYESSFQLTLYQLMKSFTQIQGKKAAVALMQGSMSGFADMSNVPNVDMQWTYSEEKYKPRGKKLINNKVKT